MSDNVLIVLLIKKVAYRPILYCKHVFIVVI